MNAFLCLSGAKILLSIKRILRNATFFVIFGQESLFFVLES